MAHAKKAGKSLTSEKRMELRKKRAKMEKEVGTKGVFKYLKKKGK